MFPTKQVVATQVGSPDVLTIVEARIGAPADGQIVVKVEASGVLYGDIMRRTDRYLTPTPFPYHPGTEIAGTIAATGSGVTDRKIGDRVAGFVPSHGYAQYAIAESAAMVDLPTAIGFGEATALLAQGTTAYLLTHDAAALRGRSVFIESAAGGVGQQMVQMARALGASFVVGSASTEDKRSQILRNGADKAVTSIGSGWAQDILEATSGNGLDVAYESSGASFAELVKCLGPFGTIVKFGRGVNETLSFEPSRFVFGNQSLRGFYLPGYRDPAQVGKLVGATREVLRMAQAGDLRVKVDRRYRLSEASLAHRAIEERATSGKVVLEPWSE